MKTPGVVASSASRDLGLPQQPQTRKDVPGASGEPNAVFVIDLSFG